VTGSRERVAFVQPFGLASPAGGPRILRALVEAASVDVFSISTAPTPPPATELASELHVPLRPPLPLERTRLGRFTAPVDLAGLRALRRRLGELFISEGVTRVHSIPHRIDFAAVAGAAEDTGVPLYLSVHDDLGYVLKRRPERRWALRHLAGAWRQAQDRFVITEAMGNEWDRRYGARPWTVVTDGVTDVKFPPPPPDGALRVYFMGSLHLSYTANLEALVAALPQLDGESPAALWCRGGGPPIKSDQGRLKVLPFANEDTVQRDFDSIHVNYLPLPFAPEHDSFVRYSLPTKLITYLASGRPTVLHGPHSSSTAALLRDHGAGVIVDSQDPSRIAAAVQEAHERAEELVKAAAKLAHERFDLHALQDRFWSRLLA
jgi:hypothetical protein